MSSLSQFLAQCFKKHHFKFIGWHDAVHNMFTASRQVWKFFQTNWTFYFLFFSLYMWLMSAGRALGFVNIFYTTLKFIQRVPSTVCDMSTSKIKQTRQHSTWTTKNSTPRPKPSIAIWTAVTFVPHKSTNPTSGSVPTSVFCLFIRNLFYQLSNYPAFFSFKDLVFLYKCFYAQYWGYWKYNTILLLEKFLQHIKEKNWMPNCYLFLNLQT